jgi:hypothetical protein
MPTSTLREPSWLSKSTSACEYCQLPTLVVSPFGSCRFMPATFVGRNSTSSPKATGGTGFRLVKPSAAFCICSAAAVSWAKGLLVSGAASPQAATPASITV